MSVYRRTEHRKLTIRHAADEEEAMDRLEAYWTRKGHLVLTIEEVRPLREGEAGQVGDWQTMALLALDEAPEVPRR